MGFEYRKLTEERENGELQIVARDRDDKNVFNGVIVGKRKSIILRQKRGAEMMAVLAPIPETLRERQMQRRLGSRVGTVFVYQLQVISGPLMHQHRYEHTGQTQA